MSVNAAAKSSEPDLSSSQRVDTALSESSASPSEQGRMSVVAIEDPERLAEWADEWEDLAACAIEPNVFYEPWLLMPALEAFEHRGRLIHLLVFSTNPASPSDKPVLCAYFPLERVRRFHGMPVPALTLWKHIHCFLCTPLMRPERATQSLAALFDWARTDPRGAAIVQFPQVAADGLFRKTLIDHLQEDGRAAFIYGTYNRALFVPRSGADAYLHESLSGKTRKQIRRLSRRISELGRVEFAELTSEGDLEAWVESFLRLEASGWKGRADSALACHETERRFFEQMAREAFSRKRLMMLAMHLDGRPIAMKCNVLAGQGSFSFKIAFDESYARFSPGVLLEVENIRRLHQAGSPRWMDSCAVSNHSMANRLWIDRRTIQTFTIATGRAMSGFLVSVMPLVKWFAHMMTLPHRGESLEAGRRE